MRLLDLLTQPHQAMLLFLWVYVFFGLAYPEWRERMNTQPPRGSFWWGILWTIVAVVAFVAWLRLMIV